MAQKDAKDILKEIKADMEGVDPKDIQFKDLRERKKRIKKSKKIDESESGSDIMQNHEGFAIMGTETKFCDYKDIGNKSRFKEKKSLEEWGAFDFFRFAHKLYLKRYKTEWDLNIGGNSLEINRIKDKFDDLFGFCCNLMIRDYIVFFFDNHIDDFKNKDGFYFNQMRKDWIISNFKESYNFRERFVSYMLKEKQNDKKHDLTKDGIQKSYDMGESTLIGNYGVVVGLNWLLRVKRKSKKEATKIIVDACRNMYKKDMIDVVRSATETYSPYPSNLAFKSPQLIFDKIGSKIKLDVQFDNDDKMKFLQKGDN